MCIRDRPYTAGDMAQQMPVSKELGDPIFVAPETTAVGLQIMDPIDVYKRQDIGRCNDRYFCNNIAAGVITKVIEEVTPKEKSILGPIPYFLRAGQALVTTKDYTYRIKTENDDFICKSPLVLALLTNVVSSFEPVSYTHLDVYKRQYYLNIL